VTKLFVGMGREATIQQRPLFQKKTRRPSEKNALSRMQKKKGEQSFALWQIKHQLRNTRRCERKTVANASNHKLCTKKVGPEKTKVQKMESCGQGTGLREEVSGIVLRYRKRFLKEGEKRSQIHNRREGVIVGVAKTQQGH